MKIEYGGLHLKGTVLKAREAYRVMFQEYPDVVGVEELQSMLGIGKKTAYGLLKAGDITTLQTGRKYRIPKVCVIDYVISSGSS